MVVIGRLICLLFITSCLTTLPRPQSEYISITDSRPSRARLPRPANGPPPPTGGRVTVFTLPQAPRIQSEQGWAAITARAVTGPD